MNKKYFKHSILSILCILGLCNITACGTNTQPTKTYTIAKTDSQTEEIIAPDEKPVFTSENDTNPEFPTDIPSEPTTTPESESTYANTKPSTHITPNPNSFQEQDNTNDGYRLIEVDGGNQSGHREANVKVDIGYGDRIYWAYTNEHGQLVKVTADEIILQNDTTEP